MVLTKFLQNLEGLAARNDERGDERSTSRGLQRGILGLEVFSVAGFAPQVLVASEVMSGLRRDILGLETFGHASFLPEVRVVSKGVLNGKIHCKTQTDTQLLLLLTKRVTVLVVTFPKVEKADFNREDPATVDFGSVSLNLPGAVL